MRDLGAQMRLEVWEQFKPAGVIGAMVRPAQRHYTVGVIAAALRARRQMGRGSALRWGAQDSGAWPWLGKAL